MFKRGKKYYYEGDVSTTTLVCVVALGMVLLASGFFIYNLSPASADRAAAPVVFEVTQGESFRGIAEDLYNQHLVKSSQTFAAFSVLDSGQAFHLQPGLYKLSAGMSSPAILAQLANVANRAVTVTIPEGSNIYQIDAILANALVIQRGDLINLQTYGNLEGMLFPDTYQFFPGSNVEDVVQVMLANFKMKAVPLLPTSTVASEKDLIIASLLEKEVPGKQDQELVAGIINKRLAIGMALDIDATICYMKQQSAGAVVFGASSSISSAALSALSSCYPLTADDFKIDSPYNTYLYKGLPPAPIGNPGIQAITAALNQKSSPYLYYLSDPKTGKTIYAGTLAQQIANERKYLE